MLPTLLTAVLAAAPTAQDLIDGAEIGNAEGYVAFESHGKYRAERVDKVKGKTLLLGTWSLTEGVVEVKIASCKGPACKELNKPYKAEVTAAAERALLVKTIPPEAMFPSGSYYCHYLGCEKRIGVELLSKNARAKSVTFVLDTLIDKNKGRNTTIVWWGRKLADDVKKSRLEYCGREGERAKKGAEEVAADLATLSWVGKLEPTLSAEADCLWDVRVLLADDLTPPARVR
ncbi:MAG: hypothetical protein H6Q89_3579 [Myxococcaceae bacterium]|nr:hypothetical protein [Myxococcaceae bacterium]